MPKVARIVVLASGVAFVLWLARSYVSASEVHADPSDPCSFLVADDFAVAGLSFGTATPDSSPAGAGCRWAPVLGTGGSVRMQIISLETYGKRRALDERALVPVPSLGDEAFSIAGMSGEQLYVKKGQRAFRIDGDGQFDRTALRPLARAVADRL